MTLDYLTLTLPIPDALSAQWVESSLAEWGDPIRWAITHIQNRECTIEAVVLLSQKGDRPNGKTMTGETPSQ